MNKSVPEKIVDELISAKDYIVDKIKNTNDILYIVITNEWKEPGSYNVQFTTNGKQLASGMYFYTLTAGKFTDTKKFILLK